MKNLSDYLREGEVISHTCYGNTYRATYQAGLLVDVVDPGLVFASPSSFANSHLEKGKANGWDKCKVERDGVSVWLKNLPKLVGPVGPVAAAGAEPESAVAVATKKLKLKLRAAADIKLGLATQSMPRAVPAAAAPTTKPKRAATGAAKKPRAAASGSTSSAAAEPVYVPPAEPSVICAKVVEGTDGLMDVCSTQLMILDYFKYNGVLYYKEASTQEVFEISTDKSIGPCIGVWDSDDMVLKAPYVDCGDGDE